MYKELLFVCFCFDLFFVLLWTQWLRMGRGRGGPKADGMWRPDAILSTSKEASICSSPTHLAWSSGKANSMMKKPFEGHRKEGNGPGSSVFQPWATVPILVVLPGPVYLLKPWVFQRDAFCPCLVKTNTALPHCCCLGFKYIREAVGAADRCQSITLGNSTSATSFHLWR